jgi:hypothetical protein
MGGEGGKFSYNRASIDAYAYFYTDETQLKIAIGVTLLVWGILVYKEKRK